MWFSLGSPTLVEMALAGEPDLIVLDLQHGLWERRTLEYAVGLARRSVPVIARLADHDAHSVSEALDAGVASILAPFVETAEQARALVSYAHFPPAGIRSAGGVRALATGMGIALEDSRQVKVGAMIETVAGVAAVESIAAVPGLDYLFIGTGDLALSCAAAGAQDPAAAVRTDSLRILAAARARGIACGIFTDGIEDAKRQREAGFDFVVLLNDISMARDGFAAAGSAWRK